MVSINGLIAFHKQEMVELRGQSRQARLGRTMQNRALNKKFKELRSKIAAEMPTPAKGFFLFRAPVAFAITVLGVLSF
ncbi:hypothetical protein [Maridesulfovibrio frigidus]|uniref:hypothetical protein n=1 Tax=Maridesulfovibrio frigidus TaxID=340956 RepID=UPI0004E18EA9|nr:hypothetical protein [Maridesulfovibrio frigidus]